MHNYHTCSPQPEASICCPTLRSMERLWWCSWGPCWRWPSAWGRLQLLHQSWSYRKASVLRHPHPWHPASLCQLGSGWSRRPLHYSRRPRWAVKQAWFFNNYINALKAQNDWRRVQWRTDNIKGINQLYFDYRIVKIPNKSCNIVIIRVENCCLDQEV